MDSRILDNVILVAMLSAAVFVSIVFGVCVYYLTASIFEIAQALNTPEMALVRIQLAAPEAMLGAYVWEGTI
jgi:hypothetical protein